MNMTLKKHGTIKHSRNTIDQCVCLSTNKIIILRSLMINLNGVGRRERESDT